MAEQKRQNSRRSGQAVVEFALVLPVFLLLLLGVVEFGRIFLRLHLLTNASREGARVASLPGNLEADVQDRVSDLLEAAGMEAGSWTTNMLVTDRDGIEKAGGLADAVQGDRVNCTVASDFQVLTGTFIPGIQGILNLSRSTVFRHE